MRSVFASRRGICFGQACLVTLALVGLLGAEERTAVPDSESQAKSLERIKGLFADEYAATGADAKQKLAVKLLDLAKADSKPANQFVLYREAIQLGSTAGDFETTMAAVSTLGNTFAIEAGAVRRYALANLSKSVSAQEAGEAVADECMRLASQMLVANRFAEAKEYLSLGNTAARKVRSGDRVSKIKEMDASLAALAKEFVAVQDAATALAANANDPAANLAVGKFECFVKGNWAGGLVQLAKGNDPTLKSLAEQSLTPPTDPAGKFQLAGEWWKVGEQQQGVARQKVLGYASAFYHQALPGLAGLNKIVAEKRLSEVAPAAANAADNLRPATGPINLIGLLDPQQDFHPADKWAIQEGALFCTRGSFVPKVIVPYEPPEEYDVKFTFMQPRFRNGVGLILPNHKLEKSQAIFVARNGGHALGVMSDDGKYVQNYPQQIFAPNVKYTVVVKVRRDSIQATVNNKSVIDLKTDFSDLKVGSWHHVNNWKQIALFADDPAVFYEVELTEVTGRGANTRDQSSAP